MKRRNLHLSIYIVFILSFVLRFIFLAQIPYRVDGDSSRFTLDGISAWQNHWPFFSTGWQAHTNAYFYLVGFFMKIFNHHFIGIRVFSALGGFLATICIYFLVRKIFGKETAFWSSLFVAVCPFLLVFSRVGTEVIWTTFFVPGVILLSIQEKRKHIFLAGILCGISQYFYPGLRLLPILAVALIVLLLIHKKIKLLWLWRFVYIFFSGVLLSYGPMLIYYYHHPDTYMARVKIVGILQSGWLKEALQSKHAVGILTNHFVNSITVFHLPVPTTPFWFVRTPFIDPLFILFFTVGMTMAIIKIKTWVWQWLFFYFFTGIFLGGFFTIGPPMPSRYIILFPALACFVGQGVTFTISLFKKHPKAELFFSVGLGLLLVITSIVSYFQHEAIDSWKYDHNTQIATYAGRYLASLPNQNYNIYFIGNNNLYYEAIRTLPLLTKKKGVDVFGPVEAVLSQIPAQHKNYFIILDSREKELETIRHYFPHSQTKTFYNPLNQFLFWLIEV